VILVATDFSDLSDLALTHGLRLARRMNAPLLIAHVSPTHLLPARTFAGTAEVELHDDEARMALDRLREEAISNGVPAEAELLHGPIVPHLLQLIERVKPEMVVVGSHGRSGVSRLVLGSVSESLCRKSAAPVLVVTDPARREPDREDEAL
jgi:nucleotide-binding universal stress UspA family protein